jgi:choline kinase
MEHLQAVVLAAGDGGRLHPRTSATPKPLLRAGGRPIINHVLDALFAAGVRDTTVVVGYRGDQIRDALANLSPCGMTLRFVENEHYLLGNARSLWAARDAVHCGFVLAMADHLLEPAILRALTAGADGRCRLAVDRAAQDDPRAHEATRARIDGGRVVDLGKHIDDWNALDTGAFWCTPAVFDAITPELRDGEAGAVFASLARAGRLDAVDVTGSRWVDIDTEHDLRDAEAMLAGSAAAARA